MTNNDVTKNNESILEELCNPDREDHARSLLDLIYIRTIDMDIAAWLVSLVSGGASWIAGSGPGGIGKSTTMRSLLSFVPAGRRFGIARPEAVTPDAAGPHCTISLELSDHKVPGYLWDQDLRDFFQLSESDHQLVGNVHADDLEQIHGQIVGDCEVPGTQFQAANILLFICLEGGNPPGGRIKDNVTRRVINKMYYSDGASPHVSVFDPDTGLLANAPRNAEDEAACKAFLEDALHRDERSIAGVRKAFLEWRG